MIHFRCQSCHRPLEVDDDLAGKKVACPHCQQVTVAKGGQRTTASGVPFARPRAAAGRVPAGEMTDDSAEDYSLADSDCPSDLSSDPTPTDRASALGLPPDSGPEQHVLTVHPAMGRARPLWGLGLGALVVLGLVLIGYGIFKFQDSGMPWLYTGVGFLVAGGLWWVVWKIQCMTISLIITNKRTTLRQGILRRETKEILHDKVQDLQIRQSFIERMCKVGSIGLSSSSGSGSGGSGIEIEVDNIPDPVRIREVVDAYREIG